MGKGDAKKPVSRESQRKQGHLCGALRRWIALGAEEKIVGSEPYCVFTGQEDC